MKKIAAAFLAALLSTSALGATLLPNGEQQFIDATGTPYAYGKVYFYSNWPTCSVLKNTYTSSDGLSLNPNPVVLNAAGRATIFGSGAYCQVLKDANGNTVWTKYTSDTSSASNLGWGGTSGGTANAQTLTVTSFTGVNGQTFYFKAGTTNTSATTLSVNAGAPIAVVRDTPTGSVFLTGGEIIQGNIIGVTYDQTAGTFHLITNNTRQFGFMDTVPAAATMDLNASNSHVVAVTGSGASITSFGSGGVNSNSNTIFFVRFDGVNTIVASAYMVTPTGGDIVVGAGTSLTVLWRGFVGGGVWEILQVSSGSGGSVGQLSAFAGGACPTGWLKANGAAVSQTTYAALYAVVGTLWGPAAAGNFTLPDLRGMFVRGVTDGRATDPSGGALTVQTPGQFVDDQFQSHTHAYDLIVGGTGLANGAGFQTGSGGNFTAATGGTETNPKNVGALYCVKY